MTLEDYTSGNDPVAIKRIKQCGWEWAAEEEAHWFPDRTLAEVRAAFKMLRSKIK